MKQLTALLIVFAMVFISGCGDGAVSAAPELKQAAKAFRHMAKPSELSRSMFSAAYPNGKPSQYVSFLFSGPGTAEWPIPLDEYEEDAMRSARIPVIPQGLPIVKNKPDEDRGMQLVIRYDDGRNVVIAEGYEDPKKPAVLRREWELPKVKPAPGVAILYQSNRGAGASFQSD